MMKKYERAVWLIGVCVLLITLVFVYDSKRDLERLFIAGPDQRELTERSIVLLMRGQGMNREDVDRIFVTSYAYFSKETCIRFLPRSGVIGGPMSFCYDANGTHQLLRVDKVA